MGFDKKYWQENFSDPESMDGIGNRSYHAKYVKYLLLLDGIQISSMVDLGFGLGYLFDEFKSELAPKRTLGIEPSKTAFEEYLKRSFNQQSGHEILNIGLKNWVKKKAPAYDLGICTSVFQYLTDQEMEELLPKIAKKVRFLYLTVPTDRELRVQKEEHDFRDQYAISRSRTKYLKYLSPHFTFISSRFLESKYFYDVEDTHFNEFLFRF